MIRDWTQTWSGTPVSLPEPQAEEIRFCDVAVGLARTLRFNGGTSLGYTVAQHSVFVSRLAEHEGLPQWVQRWALLHDAHEYVLSDLSRPVKRTLGAEAYHAVAEILDTHVRDLWVAWDGVADLLWQDARQRVSRLDNVALATEARDLMRDRGAGWRLDESPHPDTITPWPTGVALCAFVGRARDLGVPVGTRDHALLSPVLHDARIGRWW